MDAAQRNALRKCRVRLVNDLMIGEMFDQIEAHGLFTPIMLECIKARESRPEQVRTFLDYLQRRGPDAYDKFLQCLRESQHEFIAQYVEAEYQNQLSSSISRTTNNTNSSSTTLHTVCQSSSFHGQETPVLPLEHTGSNLDAQVSRPVEESQGSRDEEMVVELRLEELKGAEDYMDMSSGAGDGQDRNLDNSSRKTCWPSEHSSGTSLNIITTTGYTGNLKEEYRMESDPRGLLLIINNKTFQGGLSNRDGTDIDCQNLRELFLRLGFGVDVRENLKALEILANLRFLSKLESLRNVDCLAIAILTHGTEDFLFGVDAKYISVNDAFEPFTAERCPALHHKPKFFIINACRGDAEDKGCPASTNYEKSSIKYDAEPLPSETPNISRIPNLKDFLVAYSTIPGHVSWRHLNDGSWFVQGFVKVFSEHAYNTDVLKMLVKVNDQVSQNINHSGVQIPAPQVMLTKTWYLNPLVNDAV